jgi:hypothetical protein
MLEEGKPLTKLYKKRKAKNQDLVAIISDQHNRRGTGKTTLSLKLAQSMDRTGGLEPDQCSINPDQLIHNYTTQPPGSALVLDEAEASLSKYEAASSENRAVRELVSMGRVEQKYVLFNLPASSAIDRDLKKLCDVWIMVTELGEAVVHFLPYQPYAEKSLNPRVSKMAWTEITDPDLQSIYDDLTKRKREYLRGDETDSGLIEADQLHDQLESAQEEAEMETRNDLVESIYETSDITQAELAEAVGLSRSRIADILR